MWSLHRRAITYNKSPSEIVGIEDCPILEYWVDEVVGWFGNFIEAKLNERTKNNKPRYSLDKLLGVRTYAKYKTGRS